MTLQKTIYLKATKPQVWAYLTEPAKMAAWFHAPKSPLTAGQPYEMFGTTSGDKLMWGDVLVSEPHDRLDYTFTITPMGDAVSTVSFTLDDVPGGVRLTLNHTGLPAGEEAFGLTLALDKGWDGHLGDLRSALHDS